MSENKVLGVSDIVLMNIVAILSIRQIPNVAPYGASSVLLWILAALGLFVPLAMVCGELSTGWPKEGGIFVWVREAYGPRIGWQCAFLFICCCVLFFPMMLQFMMTTIAFCFNAGLANSKAFIGITSIIVFWILTLLNIYGMEWTKKINNFGALFGVIVPGVVLILLAVYWLASGHPMQTDYHTAANWIPNLGKWSTIVFLSSMMFAFAGMEVSPMIAGRCKNPQKDFPRAILISAIIIVAIYIIGTIALNAIFPANDANIIAGIMQGMKSASVKLGIPWLLPLMGILIAIGALGQINSWMVGPIYMLNVANEEQHVLGSKINEMHPKYNTPAFALIIEAILVSIFCLSTFVSPSMEAAYWTLTALNTLCYFIPYLLMFSGFFILRKKYPDVKRSFKIPGKVLPVLLPALGFLSTLFAIVLLFVPPDQINLGNLVAYEVKIAGGGILFAAIGDFLYLRALKKNKKIENGAAV